MTTHDAWPALPLQEWRPTKEALHRFCQIVGKIRMTLVPFDNHWWHVTLRPTPRGLTTGPMRVDDRDVEIELQLGDRRVVVDCSTGERVEVVLEPGLTVAALHARLFEALHDVGVEVEILAQPFDLPGPPFAQDTGHRYADPDAATRYLRVLSSTAAVFTEFAGWFNGKTSPVQLYWHSFDLAVQRYSGRPAPPRPDADPVTQEAYSHEVISAGFWPGDDRTTHPAYYSYIAPGPEGLTDRTLRPERASWLEGGTATLAYDDVRTAEDPRATLLAFLDSVYEAAAGAAGWDVAAFATAADPQRGR